MAEKEPIQKTPRARSTTTTKVARKTVTKKTTRKKVVTEEEVVPAVVYQEQAGEVVRQSRTGRRRGMTLGFLLSSFALLSAASAAAVYIGYTSEGQINVAQRLAEAPANFESDGNIGNDDDGESDAGEPAPQGIPFGILEMAGDGAVSPPPPVEQATTTDTAAETASSTEAVDAEAAPEAQVEGAAISEPAPVEAVTPEAAAEATPQ